MILPGLCVILLILSDFPYAEPQTQSQGVVSSQNESNFQPGIGILMGVLSITFLLSCILLVYARFCLDGRSSSVNPRNHFTSSGSWSSGIEKSVIDSLPFFRFSSLKGSREGLECSVCLSRFEDVEILRLLPQCKHAFHVGCIDQWLEGHSSCPLCRQRLDPEDPRIFTYSDSMRFLLRNNSMSLGRDDAGIETELRPYIQREVEESRWPLRFGLGSSLRRLFGGGGTDADGMHRFKHRIIVPRVIFNNRWSDVRSSDLVLLSSEMINSELSDETFDSRSDARQLGKSGQSTAEDHVITLREEMELKRTLERKFALNNETTSVSGWDAGKGLEREEKRTMSEITAMPRFAVSDDDDIMKRDRTKRLWLPIARRTVQWFVDREKRSEEPQNQFSENTRNV